MIYFIRAEHSRNTKIGYTSHAPERRLAVLQTGCFEPLTLVGSIEGGKDDEKALHARFAAHRLHGEWFSPAEEVTSGIEALLAQPDLDYDPEPLKLRPTEMYGDDVGVNNARICCPCCGADVRVVESNDTLREVAGVHCPVITIDFYGTCQSYWRLFYENFGSATLSRIEVWQDCRENPDRVQSH